MPLDDRQDGLREHAVRGFSLGIPANPGLVGTTVLLQTLHVGALPGLPIEASTGLAVRFVL